jgi:hypothetical protein
VVFFSTLVAFPLLLFFSPSFIAVAFAAAFAMKQNEKFSFCFIAARAAGGSPLGL